RRQGPLRWQTFALACSSIPRSRDRVREIYTPLVPQLDTVRPVFACKSSCFVPSTPHCVGAGVMIRAYLPIRHYQMSQASALLEAAAGGFRFLGLSPTPPASRRLPKDADDLFRTVFEHINDLVYRAIAARSA